MSDVVAELRALLAEYLEGEYHDGSYDACAHAAVNHLGALLDVATAARALEDAYSTADREPPRVFWTAFADLCQALASLNGEKSDA